VKEGAIFVLGWRVGIHSEETTDILRNQLNLGQDKLQVEDTIDPETRRRGVFIHLNREIESTVPSARENMPVFLPNFVLDAETKDIRSLQDIL
jgi:hypothetical protein